jgi:aspartokinase
MHADYAVAERRVWRQPHCLFLAVVVQDLTARARDSLVSFGERMSTRIFTSYLRQRGVPARQFDAPEIGFITSDDFGNADIIYEQTLPKVCMFKAV